MSEKFHKMLIRVDLDPPDLVRQMEIATDLAKYVKEKYPMTIRKITSDVLTDEEWRG